MRTLRFRRLARGVSLIEVMITTTLGLTLSAGIGMYFIGGTRSSREDINLSAMLDELSYATGQLTTDLEMAGFWAQAHDPSTIDRDGSLAVGTDCGAAGWYQDLEALEVFDANAAGATTSAAAAAFPCLSASDLVEGSDIVAIKRVLGRVAGTDTDASGMKNGTMYLRSHDRFGALYLRGAGTPGTVQAPYQEWEYAPVVYYVQKYAASASESPRIPSLCRMVLRSASGGAPSFMRECIAQGIEDLQLEIGVDSDEDGGANYFTPSPSATALSRASSVKLYLRVRTQRPDLDYRNEKTYQIGNSAAFTPAGADVHYHRKTLSSEVALRNPRALQGVSVQ